MRSPLARSGLQAPAGGRGVRTAQGFPLPRLPRSGPPRGPTPRPAAGRPDGRSGHSDPRARSGEARLHGGRGGVSELSGRTPPPAPPGEAGGGRRAFLGPRGPPVTALPTGPFIPERERPSRASPGLLFRGRPGLKVRGDSGPVPSRRAAGRECACSAGPPPPGEP